VTRGVYCGAGSRYCSAASGFPHASYSATSPAAALRAFRRDVDLVTVDQRLTRRAEHADQGLGRRATLLRSGGGGPAPEPDGSVPSVVPIRAGFLANDSLVHEAWRARIADP